MNRPGHDDVKFFFGAEVEHTPAHKQYTMFIVGECTVDEIAKNISKGAKPVTHLYFGANMSFPQHDSVNTDDFQPWINMIQPFLEKGYLCTLDIDVTHTELLVKSPLCGYNNFIPMISVKLPYIQMLGYNATIKLDDQDFMATNPGVWCHSVHDLMSRNTFTDWSKYSKDEIK